MAKPYSQDLRDRVIDAVERGKMSRRAAGRHYEVSELAAIKWLERLERHGSESLSDMAAIALPSSCRTGTF
jgi:transposase